MLLDFKNLKEKYKLDITGVIQVGAHYGEEFESTWLNEPSIKYILLFEPDPDNFKVLKSKTDNVKTDKTFYVVDRGLGPFSCEMTMYKETSNNGQSNSVLKPKVHLEAFPHIVFNNKTTIKIEPLDKYECSKDFNFLSIDVQGFELEVLRGARKTLKNIQWIMLEVNRAETYENCAQIDEVDEFLAKYNFKRVETSWWENSFWGDAFYIKN
jgi:FkbM family methyltransferase